MRCAPTDRLERACMLLLDLHLDEERKPVEGEWAAAYTRCIYLWVPTGGIPGGEVVFFLSFARFFPQ